MKTNEITAEMYRQTMPRVWRIVRNYCEDDEEAKNVITMSVENYLYDTENGVSFMRAIRTACEELYIEEDYMLELYEGIVALDVETEPEDEDDEDEEDEDEEGEYYMALLGMGDVPPVCRI